MHEISLFIIANLYKKPSDLAKDKRVFVPLSEAAGISTKASNYLDKADISGIVDLSVLLIFLRDGHGELAGGDPHLAGRSGPW